MPVLRARAPGNRGAVRHRWAVTSVLIAAVAFSAAGCAAPPAPSLAAAADPNARVPATRYNSVTAPYTRQRPVEPLPWRERNDRVAPQGGQ